MDTARQSTVRRAGLEIQDADEMCTFRDGIFLLNLGLRRQIEFNPGGIVGAQSLLVEANLRGGERSLWHSRTRGARILPQCRQKPRFVGRRRHSNTEETTRSLVNKRATRSAGSDVKIPDSV